MRTTSAIYKQIIASGETRNYEVRIDMTLADNGDSTAILDSSGNPILDSVGAVLYDTKKGETQITLTNEDIWTDSFGINTASSGQNAFDIGNAIIGMCKFNIDNFDERFNFYDFWNEGK